MSLYTKRQIEEEVTRQLGQGGGGGGAPLANNLITTAAGSALDARQGKILSDLITTLKGGSSVTIATLVSQMGTLTALVTDTTPDGGTLVSTIQELLSVFSNYPEGASVADALAGKVSTSAINNSLTQTAANTVLDARQGKALKDLIDSLQTQVNSLSGGGPATPLANNLTTTVAGSALDATQGKILSDAIASGNTATLNTVRGGVASAGDTLAKLYALIQTLNSIVGGTTADGDSLVNTVTELLTVFSTYSESVDIATLINSKATGAVVNALTQTAAGGVLDARQGKVLGDAIATINATLAGLANATTQGNTFNGASQLVKLDGTGKLPAIDGSNLTNLPGGGGATTLPFAIVTSFTSAAIQAAINAITVNGTIYLMPGTYTISTPLTFGGKTNVTIEGFGAATLTTATNNILVINGNTTDCTLSGIKFVCTATGGGGQGLVSANELGAHKNFNVVNCSFDSPTYRINGFSINTYSSLSDGGSGQGKLFDGIHFDKCNFGTNGGIGRMGIEILNHAWNDSSLAVYVKNVLVTNCTFNDTGKVAETGGTVFNGMPLSVSGRCENLIFTGNTVVDAKTYGLEIVGTNGATVTGNNFDYVNNSYIPVSLADGYGNGADATKNITITGNFMRSKSRPMNSRGASNVNLSNNTFVGTTDEAGNTSSLYFQKCTGVTITGGSLISGAFNPMRLDDCREFHVNIPRIIGTNTTQNYASISIYGGSGYAGAGSATIRLTIANGLFKKSNGVTTTPSQIYETIGGVNVTDVTTDVPVVTSTVTQVNITSGSASTLANAAGTVEVYIDPAALLASYALTFMPTPIDNQRVTVHFGGTILSGNVVTAFSVVAGAGQAVLQATTPSSVEAGEAISYIYNLTKTKWYRSY